MDRCMRPLRQLALVALIVSAFFWSCRPPDDGDEPGDPPSYAMVRMSRMPVSLDILFRTGDPTRRTQMLNTIRSGRPESTALFLVPYPNYFHHNHFPATLKWYLYTGGHTPISLPLPGFLEVRDDANRPIRMINNTPCVDDVTAVIHLSYYIRVELGHCCLRQDLVQRFHGAGSVDVFGRQRRAVAVATDEALGYTHLTSALDFIVEDDTRFNFDPQGLPSYLQHRANPYHYFSDGAQSQLRSHYQAQLDAMNDSGLYPESRLDRGYDINQGGGFYGAWFYQQGYLRLDGDDHPYGWYSFDGCILNILSLSRTDRSSFWKNAANGQPFGADVLGVFCDAYYPGSVADYAVIGGRYLVRCEGNEQAGVVRLDDFFANVRPSPLYMKYQFEEGGSSGLWDDRLHVDYFPSLAAARGPFSARKLTYGRMYERND